jgi:hypothetical protein
MSLQKRIASRLTEARRSLKRRARKQRLSNRFTLERLEERQLLAADFLAGEVIVQFDASMTEEMRASVRPAGSILVETIHTAMMQRVGEGVMERLQLSDSFSIDQAIEYYEGMNGVQFAEPNYIVTTAAVSNDNFYTNGSLWGMFSDDTPTAIGPGGTTNQFGSQAEKAWDQDILGSSDVIVGVIDTGVQVDHPDLVNNIWVNPFDAVDGIDNDGNGYVDDTWGWDFAGNDRIVYDSTADDHGTHVAGTIGAEGGNSIGVAGVNWDVAIVSLKFLAPSGSTTNAIRAVDYLTDLKVRHNLNIVASNNSWGGGGYSTGLHAAIIRSAKSDILFFAAAGNSASNNDAVNAYPTNYSTLVAAGSTTPASYDGVVAVANITSTGALSGSSSYGATTVDIGAPGNNIWSTLPAGSYGSFSGTSMATPHVAGAAALYKSHYPTATAEQIRDILLNTAKPTPSLNGRVVTDGRLDVAAMLAVPPVPSITISNETVAEGDSGLTQVIFTVTLSEVSTDVITVDYSTRGGSATAGIDYVSISGTLTFNPGETTQTIAVDVYGDTDVELREDFFVDLTNPTNAIIDFPFGVGEIISEDVPEVTIQDVSIIEGNSGYKALYFTFVLSDQHSENVSIVYSTEDGSAKSGSDYQGVSGSLVIPAGDVSGTVRINIIGDSIIEDNETFYLRLFAADQAILNDDAALATIINDDSEQGITISDSAVLEGNSGRKSIYFTVSLAQASNSFITIHYATRNNTATTADRDYVAVSGQVSIRPGATSATIAIPVLGDRKAEQDETFFVDLIRAFGAVISDGLAVGRIFNDDAGKVIPTPPPAANGFSSLAEAAASASAATLSPSALPIATSGGSSSTGVSLTPLTGSTTRLVVGPKMIHSNNLTQMLAVNRGGPRVTESFAASVDLALVALLKDGERLAKLG